MKELIKKIILVFSEISQIKESWYFSFAENFWLKETSFEEIFG